MAEVARSVLDAIGQGRRITVYGDFDCDGVCATSILVSALRELGAECDWFIPDRIADGYGLNGAALEGIAGRGTSLVITVDCGVTAVEEVKMASELGLEMIVTDHHQPGADLPDCAILHPQVSGYPFPSLCGAAVAAKLASALRREAGVDPVRDEADLDLVALATVTDVMPLRGENRHLVSAGTKVARRARRVGLAALMADCRIEASRLSAEDFGFRLGPRINAAGRMYRADAGVELFLSDSRDRADEIATELSGANAERRRVEREVETAAKAELRKLGETGTAVVVAGEGWHPGVVGIVASRLVGSEGRPAVVISLDGDTGRGSARTVPGLDLHDALGEVSGLLETFGGHAAAAGLSIRAERIDEFRDALSRAVEKRIGDQPAEQVLEFDAVAGGPDLDLDLAEEIEKLAPFGSGNPAVKLLIPSGRIENLSEIGEGKHCRFSVSSGSHRAGGVAFGRTGFGVEDDQRVDLLASLEVNHWNGSIEPQLKVSEVRPAEEAEPLSVCDEEEWWERFEAAMDRNFSAGVRAAAAEIELAAGPEGLPGVALAELISSGERIVVLTADARQRWRALGGSSLVRFIPDAPDFAPDQVAGVWTGSPRAELEPAVAARVLVTDYFSLAGPDGPGLAGFDRVVLLDPPFSADAVARIATCGLPVHLLAGPEESAFAAKVATHRLDLTGQLRELFRGLRESGAIDGGEISAGALRELLSADGNSLRSPEEAAALLRVLVETGLARTGGVGAARAAGVVSSKKTELTVSAVFVHHFELHKEQDRFLSQFNRQTQKP
jgi:single-stranded-DNA-specific exonuclease